MPVVLLPSGYIQTTVQDIVLDSLRLSRSVGVDQTLTADEADDGLVKFNDLLEIWSTQKLAVYGQANQTFNTVAGQAAYTIGPAGNWNTTRPIRISEPAYSVLPTGSAAPSTFPCKPITQAQYNLIAVKEQTQEYPDAYLFVNDFPLGIITLWPVPSQVTAITFSIDRVLALVSNAQTAVSFPPGYLHAFKYNLAPMLAPLYGRQIDQDVKDEAIRSLANIKRANRVTPEMRYDSALTSSGGNWQVWP